MVTARTTPVVFGVLVATLAMAAFFSSYGKFLRSSSIRSLSRVHRCGLHGEKMRHLADLTAKRQPRAVRRIGMATQASLDVAKEDNKMLNSFHTDGGPRTKVVEVLEGKEEDWVGKQVVVKGWIRTIRAQKKLAFLEINDGSSFQGLQAVASLDTLDGGEERFNKLIADASTGASVAVLGTVVKSPAKGQSLEIQCQDVKVIGIVNDNEKYPLQKKRHSLEFLRSIAHLRARTNTFAAVARVRSSAAQGIHRYFDELKFKHLHSPIITASDCEGAGEMFRVSTMDLADPPKSDPKEDPYKVDFFEKPAFLTVSGQLSAETYACAVGDVYTFGPTFRAENSQTSRHLAEFWMIEPEMAFADIYDAMSNCEGMVRAAAERVRDTCGDDLQFFGKFYEKTLKDRYELITSKPFKRIEYTEAVKLLKEEIAKDPSKWEYPEVEFGTDLATEHERWICEKWADGAATFVYNYPRDIKAFYMRDNDDGKTVAAFDLLVPGVGELAGGSQREERMDVLSKKLKEFDLIEDDYWWYMDLRKYGSVPHAGYGVGFERLVCYLTGMANVRDVIPFPRYPGNAEF
mmetsp:Transcript_20698/g.30966  ORF Transcript_20698/g.30966 Transcript_20698/m.30966 type:complete len:574 (-) Transcript_20698:253-1974(-)